MSERNEQIQALKAVFDKAKTAPRDEDGWFEDLDLYSEVGSALCNVGNKKFYELQDEIYAYLTDPYADFRAETIQTLGWERTCTLRNFRKMKLIKLG